MTESTTKSDFPKTPTAPSNSPAGYTTPTGATSTPKTPQTSAQVGATQENFWQFTLGKVTEAVQGFFHWGDDAFDELSSWATSVWANAEHAVQQVEQLIENIGGTVIKDVSDTILTLKGGLTSAESNLQKLIDHIIGGLTGDPNSEDNPIEMVLYWLQKQGTAIENALQAATSSFNLTTNFGALLHQAIYGLEHNPIYTDAEDFLAHAGSFVGILVGNAANALNGIEQAIGNWFSALTGQPASQNSDSGTASGNTATQLATLVQTVTGLQAAVQNLNANNTGTTNSGISGGDGFDYLNLTGTLPGWATYQSPGATGILAIPDSSDLSYTDSGSSNPVTTTIRLQRSGTPDALTQTVYQAISMTVGSPTPQFPGFFAPTSAYSTNDLYGRMNASGTDYVRLAVTFYGVQLYYAVGGVETSFGSAAAKNCATGSGTVYQLLCGTAGGVNEYQVLRNGSTLFTYTDDLGGGGLPLSQIDTNHLGWGVGVKACTNSGSVIDPAGINAVTIADNTPAATLGNGFRVYRSLTSSVSTDVGAITSVFDTVERYSDGVVWASSEVQIPVTGWWSFKLRLQSSSSFNTTTSSAYVQGLTVNGTLRVIGATVGNLVNSGSDIHQRAIYDSFDLYCTAGDLVQPYLVSNNGSNLNIAGEATGSKTFFSGQLSNPG